MRQEPDDRASDVGATDDIHAPLRRHGWAQTDRWAQQANGARLYASGGDIVFVAGGRKWPRARRRQGGRGRGRGQDCKAERESTDFTRLLPGCRDSWQRLL
jgi:putative intracellular protease/amidase